MSLAEFESISRLWSAALYLLLDDARDWRDGRPDPEGVKEKAYRDVVQCGPMTQRLAQFCLVDPREVSRQFRLTAIARHHAPNDPHSSPASTPISATSGKRMPEPHPVEVAELLATTPYPARPHPS